MSKDKQEFRESFYTDAQRINDDLSNLLHNYGLPCAQGAVMIIAEENLRADLLEIGTRCEDIARKIRETFVRYPGHK